VGKRVDGADPGAGVAGDVVDLGAGLVLGEAGMGRVDDLAAGAPGVGAQAALGRVPVSCVPPVIAGPPWRAEPWFGRACGFTCRCRRMCCPA